MKAFIAEELEREAEFVERIKGIRARIGTEVNSRESGGGSGGGDGGSGRSGGDDEMGGRSA